MRLEGRTALVTGGGSGIGRAAARELAREGARVLVVGRRAEPLRETVDLVEADGGEAAWRSADVTDDTQIRAAVADAVERFGGLDVLVNAAGRVPDWTPVHETPDAVWEEAMEVNAGGVFRATRAALPHLLERGGSIVSISSVSAVKGSNAVASYAAAKAAVLAFTRCVAAEYGWRGVRCNCVVPGWVETPMTAGHLAAAAAREEAGRRHALQRVARPEEVARAIVFLAAGDASFVTGAALAVDGGMAIL